MKNAILFLLDNYADWEGAFIAATLNEHPEWQVKTASVQKEVKSIGGFSTKVDYLLAELPEKVDAFILIGGQSWDMEDDDLVKKIRYFLQEGVCVAAICGAVDFLAKNGLLDGYQHTGNAQFFWSDFEKYQNKADFIEEQAVRDRNLITANGTAPIEFEKLILEALHFGSQEEIDKTIAIQKNGLYEYCKQYGSPY